MEDRRRHFLVEIALRMAAAAAAAEKKH